MDFVHFGGFGGLYFGVSLPTHYVTIGTIYHACI